MWYPALIFWTCFILTFDGENGSQTTKSTQSSQTENFDDSDYFLEDFRPARIIFSLMSLCSGKWWFWFFDDFPNMSPAFCWKNWTSICSTYGHFVRVTKNIVTHRKNVVTRRSQVVICRANNVVRFSSLSLHDRLRQKRINATFCAKVATLFYQSGWQLHTR